MSTKQHAISPQLEGLGVSATLAINELSAALQAEGKAVVKLGLGQSPFPVPAPVVAALQEHAHEKDYLPVRGLPALRERAAQHFSRTRNIEAQAKNILIGPGSKELMFILQAVLQGELLLPAPSWVSYVPQAKINNRKVTWLHTSHDSQWKLTPEALDSHCTSNPADTRILVLNSPCNPTGLCYHADELMALAEIAKKHNLVVLSDEIYGEVHFEGAHCSLAHYYPEGTIVSGGLSKWCGAGGWRLGVFVVPDALSYVLDAMAVVASESFTSVSAPIQYAAVAAYTEHKDVTRYLHDSRRLMKALGTHFAKRLQAAGAIQDLPEGGFYLFPDMSNVAEQLGARGIRTGAELCHTLLDETGVATLPGSAFGRAVDEFTIRLAFVDFDGTAALHALSSHDEPLDESFLRSYCPRVLDGAEKMCAWFEAL